MMSGEPHSEQNPRSIGFPVSDVFRKNFGSPASRRKESAQTTGKEPNALPLASWQSRQWQLNERMGSAEHSYRTAPQAQPPLHTAGVIYCSPIRLLRTRDALPNR